MHEILIPMSAQHFSIALFQAFEAYRAHDREGFKEAIADAQSALDVHPEALQHLDAALGAFPEPAALNELHRAAEYLGMVASLGYCGPERRQRLPVGPRERRTVPRDGTRNTPDAH